MRGPTQETLIDEKQNILITPEDAVGERVWPR